MLECLNSTVRSFVIAAYLRERETVRRLCALYGVYSRPGESPRNTRFRCLCAMRSIGTPTVSMEHIRDVVSMVVGDGCDVLFLHETRTVLVRVPSGSVSEFRDYQLAIQSRLPVHMSVEVSGRTN